MATNGFKAFMGDNAALQPGSLQEMMLHETAVAWIRRRQTLTTPKSPWDESVEDFGQRMRGIVNDINENVDVAGLCQAFLKRVEELIERRGGRLDE